VRSSMSCHPTYLFKLIVKCYNHDFFILILLIIFKNNLFLLWVFISNLFVLDCVQTVSHPVLEDKPNANHVRARISNSRIQQLHNMDIITQCSNSIKKGNSRLHHMSETSI
jgi:hypothetical protein